MRTRRYIRDDRMKAILWADTQLFGAAHTVRVHGVSRTCVFEICKRAAADATFGELCETTLAEVRADHRRRSEEVLATAASSLLKALREPGHSLDSRLRAFESVTRVLGLHEGDAKTSEGKVGGPGVSITLPTILTQPRVELPAPEMTVSAGPISEDTQQAIMAAADKGFRK